MNDAETVFAADLNAASKLPTLFVIRAGIFPAESASRRLLKRLPLPGRIGDSAQATFSCAAAWTTWYSTGPTTPTKSP